MTLLIFVKHSTALILINQVKSRASRVFFVDNPLLPGT
jgi:hypothetical protein